MKKSNMILNQYSKIFLTLLLVGCSEQNEQLEFDASKEFKSIIDTFNESSILEFNESNYLNTEFIEDFLEKLDPQKTVFMQADIEEILNLEIGLDDYLIFEKVLFNLKLNERLILSSSDKLISTA